MAFNALLVSKDEDSGKTSAEVTEITEDQLPEGDVTVAVEYSTVNYKDGLCIGPGHSTEDILRVVGFKEKQSPQEMLGP